MPTAAQWQKKVIVTLDVEKLKWVRKNAKSMVERQVEASAERVKVGAKRYCPVDTGRLKASIDKLRMGELEWIITYAVGDPGAYYGFFQELGTRYMSPQPFLHPALEDERPNLPRGIKAEFVKI